MIPKLVSQDKANTESDALSWLQGSSLSFLTLTDQGKTGTRQQAIGLQKALGIQSHHLEVAPKPFFSWIPRIYWTPHCVRVTNGSLHPPWPDVLITAGRTATGLGAALKKKLGNRLFHIGLMNPKLPKNLFDLILCPEHDNLKGENVLSSLLSFSPLTTQNLEKEKKIWVKRLPQTPMVGVFLGGTTRSFTFSTNFAHKLADDLIRIATRQKVYLSIIPSRRTPQKFIETLQSHLQDTPHFIWTGEGENPYAGILALADYLLITGDSVQMISEANLCKAPLYIYPLGRTSEKMTYFQQQLFQSGIARPFSGELSFWVRTPYASHSNLISKIATHLHKKILKR